MPNPSQNPYFSAFVDFVREFKSESDRAAVIIGAAKLDDILRHILSKHLLPSTTRNDELLDGESPLGTFSARIQACYRLGIIDANLARSLNLIRKLRNDFAHDVSGCRLDVPPHRDRVREIIGPYANEPAFLDFKDAFVSD